MRNGFVIIILTIAAWLYTRHREKHGKYPIKILETVPPGFHAVGPPKVDVKLLRAIGPQLPATAIVMLLEHIAIAKCVFQKAASPCIYH
jgi:sodium-independent sulfate anion transporter 11